MVYSIFTLYKPKGKDEKNLGECDAKAVVVNLD